MTTVTILLAAGRSRRFGDRNKLLAPLADRPLVLHAAGEAIRAGLGPLVAVADDPGVIALLPEFHIVTPASGSPSLGRSLAAGVAAAKAMQAARAVAMLADMPLVTAALIERVALRCTPALPSAATDGRHLSPPAAFPASWFPRLQALTDDSGAKNLLNRLPNEQRVPCPPRMLADIDWPDDLSMLGPQIDRRP